MPANARFKALVEHSPDLHCVVQDDGYLVYASPAVERILGHRPVEIEGRDLLALVHEDDRQALRASIAKADRMPLDARFRSVDGGWVYLQTVVSRPQPDAGVDGLILDARDVSQRRQAERSARASEADYRALFESSRDAILIGTIDGRLRDANPQAVQLFGYGSKDEMLELDIGRDLYWNAKDRERAWQVFLEQGYVDEIELELKTKDGRRLRVRESSTAVYDDDGEIVGFRGILRDVTEQRRLQEQLREAQKMDAVGRLAGGVAHDFNNLLTAINGYSELALERITSEDPQRRAFEEIRKAGRRATDLTRRLLTLSRHQVVSPRRIDLNGAVVDMEKLLVRVLGADIELRVDLDEDLPKLWADQAQIEQIMLNLAVNARDAMPDGGTLTLGTRRVTMPDDMNSGDADDLPVIPASGDFLLLTVADTGIGMERAVREHAFEPFFTTKGQGHNTGLGLAIVYGIVKQSGGHIEVRSRQGEGSTFYLFFPHRPREQRPAVTNEAPQVAPKSRGDETILLVEDESSVRALVRQILELQGYRVWTARTADAAIATCDDQDRAPELLLTDVVMPGRNGVVLARELRQRYPKIKLLFMSGYTDSHEAVKMVTEQKAAFVPKPFTPDALARKVRDVLDG